MHQKVYIVVGTRPNFIKITQFKRKAAILYPSVSISIIHTGQHYDDKMADVFFRQLNLTPDYYLNVSAASANKQMAEIMIKLEDLISRIDKPDILVVVGDVNSTLAAAITANKLEIKLAHIEGGLRSFDTEMPEEYNRMLTDKLSNMLFVTEQSALDNLIKEGIPQDKLNFVGNTMIDTLVNFSEQIESSDILDQLKIKDEPYVLVTLHRPATVDSEAELQKMIILFQTLGRHYQVVFPIHPRTIKQLKTHHIFDALSENKNLIMTDPLDYFAFQKLIKHSRFVLTDSGGVQEESTFLKVPCLTLRFNTERPVTCTLGTNTLIPFDMDVMMGYVESIENGTYKKGEIPPLWDGKTTERILKILCSVS